MVYLLGCMNFLIYTGTLLQDMSFKVPCTALFLHHTPNTLIVACRDGIFVVDFITQSTLPFSSTPQGVFYCPQALALSNDDTVLVAGNTHYPYSVRGYDTASRTRLWILNTDSAVCAVCLLGAHVLVTLHRKPALLLDRDTGAYIYSLHKAEGSIFGLGVIEGLRFILSGFTSSQISTHPCTSPCCSTSSTGNPVLCICR